MKGKDIQIDNGGFTRIHYAILEQLAITHLTTYEYACLMFLFRRTYGYQKKEDTISLAQWGNGTRIERRNLVKTLNGLIAKRIILKTDGYTGRGHTAIWGFNKYVEQWHVKERVCVDTPFERIERVSDDTPIVDERVYVDTPLFESEKVYVDTPERVYVDTPTKDTKEKEGERKKAANAAHPHPLESQKPAQPSAILVYREVFRLNPNVRQTQAITDQVDDLILWQRACHAWAMRGHKPTNIEGILDWYKYPERMTYTNGAGPPNRNSELGAISWNELHAMSKGAKYDD